MQNWTSVGVLFMIAFWLPFFLIGLTIGLFVPKIKNKQLLNLYPLSLIVSTLLLSFYLLFASNLPISLGRVLFMTTYLFVFTFGLSASATLKRIFNK